MVQKASIEESRFMSGLWLYRMRALNLADIRDEYGPWVADKVYRLETLAREKWRNPQAVGFTTDQFAAIVRSLGLQGVVRVYRGSHDLPVLVPRSKFLYRAFASFPNLMTIYGDRGSGKTIMAWTTAWNIFNLIRERGKYEGIQVIVYGDVDGLTEAVKKTCRDKDFTAALTMVDDYSPPEARETTATIILYNELDENLMSQSSLRQEQTLLKEMIFRSRHYKFWIVYNVIRYLSIMKTVRITSSFKAYKAMSDTLLEEVLEKGVPSFWRSIFFQAITDLHLNEAFTSIPLYRADQMGVASAQPRVYLTFTPIDPPAWLLKAADRAVKNYSIGAEAIRAKEKELIVIAADLYQSGEVDSIRKIAMYMEAKHGFKRSETWWKNKLTRYFMALGYPSLKDVRGGKK